RYREHAVLEACLDLVGIDAVGHLKGALERAEIALTEVVVLLLLLFLLLFLALDGQDAVGHFHLDVLIGHAGQFGGDFISLVGLRDIDSRYRGESGFGPPERFDIEERAGPAPGTAAELIE